ncbi:3-oxo-5-alpha-steroid 4-dehydrogenase [Flammeovirga aprica]|uniref:3-oxo-5-alpha-steroid 4-dehydrogenase C-terminal domain-containing protein n=1 Tax=Flammeovirga aprica JL-4 TaxID=694437 RepID=A0A7X9RWJ3_9BACT|nr:3-oxo-5-alpha-steroid 4-dehydrogenase [Flammeovirga aprica]NME70027.1 hypothetical protein [Flammeovirga aprica JL-4]
MIDQELLETIGWGWIGVAIITFLVFFILKVVAPFGRHTRSDWGPVIPNSWGWFFMEVISIMGLWTGFLMTGGMQSSWIAKAGMLCWTLHYINRTFIFPFRMSNKKKKMPVVIMFSAIFFNSINGTLNGYFLGQEWFYFSFPLFTFGLLLFGAGMYINIKSDNILLNLRKPGETHYVIPEGFLFKYVSSPNLFGEIIEWTGFFLMVPSVASLSFLVWTLANLIPRARDHHEWYLKTFENYPPHKNILFPKVW